MDCALEASARLRTALDPYTSCGGSRMSRTDLKALRQLRLRLGGGAVGVFGRSPGLTP